MFSPYSGSLPCNTCLATQGVLKPNFHLVYLFTRREDKNSSMWLIGEKVHREKVKSALKFLKEISAWVIKFAKWNTNSIKITIIYGSRIRQV